MEITVDVGDWDHACCGDAFALDDIVTWEIFIPRDAKPLGSEYVQTRHGRLEGRVPVTGRVVAIAATRADGSATMLGAVPSGRALRGFEEYELREQYTDVVIDEEIHDFVVTLSIAGSTLLPVAPPTS